MGRSTSFYGGGKNSFYGSAEMYGNARGYHEKYDLALSNILTFNNKYNETQIKQLKVNIDPVQNLHGYSNPWPAGGGKNLYNKEDGAYNFYYNGSTGVITNSNNARTVYISCDPNTTYTVSKAAGKRFSVCYTKTTPEAGVECFGAEIHNSASSITVTTGVDAAYLCAYVWYQTGDSSSYTEAEMLATVQIEKGPTATSYQPYSNICPITGWTGAKVQRTGKNLFPFTVSINDSTYTHTYGVSSYQTEVTKLISTMKACVGQYVTYSAKTTGTASGVSIGQLRFSNSNGTNLFYLNPGETKQVPDSVFDSCDRILIYGSINGATVSDIQFELGSTATAYEPYSGNTYDISWQSAAGTVYGGTLDVMTGVLTVDRASITFDGSDDEGWAKSTYNYFNTPRISGAINENTSPNNFLSNLYAYGNVMNATQTLGACLIWATVRVRLADMSISLDDWKDMLEAQPLQVIYSLAAPQTYQLTSMQIDLLIGQNNIWADCGQAQGTITLNTYQLTETINNVAVASFNDADNAKLKQLKVDINYQQDLHGYDSPWPAGGGKNKAIINAATLAKPSWYVVTTYQVGVAYGENNGYTVNRSNGDGGCGGFTMPISAGDYTLSFTAESGKSKSDYYRILIFSWDGTTRTDIVANTIAPSNSVYTKSFTVPSGAIELLIRIIPNSWVDGLMDKTAWINYVCVESGSTATGYAPYENVCPISGRTGAQIFHSGEDTSDPDVYAISWQSAAGTVYGGTLDVMTGVLTVNRVLFEKNSALMDNSNDYPGWKNSGVRALGYTDIGVFTTIGNVGTKLSYNFNGNNDVVFLSKQYYNSLTQTDWIALAQNVQFVIPLATPLTYQLTPMQISTLLGENNMWADTGNIITLTYKAKK